jgi:cephalosporin hydroxylase
MNLKSIREGIFKARNERNALPRYIARRFLFKPLERLGLHVLGDHFYEPIPNLRELEANYDSSHRLIPGHSLELADFESRHAARIERYGSEFAEATKAFGFDETNYYFRGADALSYYCLLRDTKPASVVEIGQGSSTRVALAALERNAVETGAAATFVSIDPYTRLLGEEIKSDHTRFEQIHQPLQALPVNELLERLQGNALLFVDSSHVYKHGSDVWHLMHQVYPKLPVGCALHVHDIVLPYPWLKDFYVKQRWFWNEQDMLEAFLAFNPAFKITLPVYWLHRESALVKQAVAKVAAELPMCDEGYSFYLKRVA